MYSSLKQSGIGGSERDSEEKDKGRREGEDDIAALFAVN